MPIITIIYALFSDPPFEGRWELTVRSSARR